MQVLVSFMHTYISVTIDNDQNRLNSNYVNSTCQVAILCIKGVHACGQKLHRYFKEMV